MRDKNARSRHMTLHVQNPPVTKRAYNSQGMTGKVRVGSVVRDEDPLGSKLFRKDE